MNHHRRSAQVWHVFSRDFTVLPAHPHDHPQSEWAIPAFAFPAAAGTLLRSSMSSRTCLPPTTRCASPQHPPALRQPLAGQMPRPRLEASTWPAKEDLDTTDGRGSWEHNSTRCGHRRRIARCRGHYGPRWSGAAVSEWVSLLCKFSIFVMLRDHLSAKCLVTDSPD